MPTWFQHVILIVSFINDQTKRVCSECLQWSRRLARALVHILWNYTIMVKTVMIILINVLSKFLNCLKSLKPQWTVHITSQLQWLKLIYRLIWSQLFSWESAGFSSCCCLVSAQHPIKCHQPQRTAELNKAWNSSSLLANGQILHPVQAGMRGWYVPQEQCPDSQSPTAFGFLPVCPQRSTGSRTSMWVLCWSVRPENAVIFTFSYKTFCFPTRHFLHAIPRQLHTREMLGPVFRVSSPPA